MAINQNFIVKHKEPNSCVHSDSQLMGMINDHRRRNLDKLRELHSPILLEKLDTRRIADFFGLREIPNEKIVLTSMSNKSKFKDMGIDDGNDGAGFYNSELDICVIYIEGHYLDIDIESLIVHELVHLLGLHYYTILLRSGRKIDFDSKRSGLILQNEHESTGVLLEEMMAAFLMWLYFDTFYPSDLREDYLAKINNSTHPFLDIIGRRYCMVRSNGMLQEYCSLHAGLFDTLMRGIIQNWVDLRVDEKVKLLLNFRQSVKGMRDFIRQVEDMKKGLYQRLRSFNAYPKIGSSEVLELKAKLAIEA